MWRSSLGAAARRCHTPWQALADMFRGEAYQALTEGDAHPSGRECLDFVVTQMKRREVFRHLSNAADRLAHAGEALHDMSVKYG